MMVAASSLLNLEHHHNKRYTNSNPLEAEVEMAYQISQVPDGSCSFKQRSVFSSQNSSLQTISDEQFCMPVSTAYQETGQKRSAVDSKLESPKEESSSNSPLEGSISPGIKSSYEYASKDCLRQKDAKSHMRNDRSFYNNNNNGTNDCNARSQSPSHQYSPPAKRIVLPIGSSVHKSELNNPDMQLISSDSSRYSSIRMNSSGNKQMITDNGNVVEYMETSTNDSATTNSSPTKGNISYSPVDSSFKMPSPNTVSRTPTPNCQSRLQSSTSMKPLPNFFFDDDDDDSWKICGVCGDKATGYHFNALTCEGCKGFFRRCMKNSKTFTCPYTGNCSITKSNRRQCQSCRLQKCLKIGMKKECIMSSDQILLKKNLVLNNRIKRNIQEWKPREMTEDYKTLLATIRDAHIQTNSPPPEGQVRNEEIVHQTTINSGNCSSASPASSTSSGFSDLINSMTQNIVATAPGNSGASKAHMQHFSDIMEFSIKEIIKFCKKIPIFTKLSLKDQITLLKSGCTEILFMKANYTYDREQNAMSCGPGKYYTKQSFILGGMSEEYTDCYLKFHHDLSHMQLDETEMSCLCAAALFSSDRDEVEGKAMIESQQEMIVLALQSHIESSHHCRERFPKVMSYLTRLRTLNWYISATLKKVQESEAKDSVTPLVLEVIPTI